MFLKVVTPEIVKVLFGRIDLGMGAWPLPEPMEKCRSPTHVFLAIVCTGLQADVRAPCHKPYQHKAF